MLLVLFQNGKLEHLIQETYLLEGAEDISSSLNERGSLVIALHSLLGCC